MQVTALNTLSDSTQPTVRHDFSYTDCIDRDSSLENGNRYPQRSTASFLLEPRISRGDKSLPQQSNARKYLKFLILVPVSTLATIFLSAIYVVPIWQQQGAFSLVELLLASTFKSSWAVRLFLVLPVALAAGYDMFQETVTMIMLLRGRQTRMLPAHIPRLVHGILICNYKEPLEVLRATVESIANNTLAKSCIVVLACEDRDPTAASTFHILHSEFRCSFRDFVMTSHMLGNGEIIGKSSNENHACRELYNLVVKKKIDPFNVMVTTCDADSLFDTVYFEQLEAEFCRVPDGRRFIYNAPINTYRNLPECNLLVQLFEIKRCQFDCFRGFDFRPAQSNYSLTLGFAKEMDFWDPTNTSEDLHTTIKAMAVTGTGRSIVLPVWSLILNDSVCSFRDRWVQAKRHMWGNEEAAYTLLMFPTLRINLWTSLFGMVCAKMFSTCTPALVYLLFPTVRLAFFSLRYETKALIVCVWMGMAIYTWIKTLVREVFLYILHDRKLMMKRSDHDWMLIILLWPILAELGALLFACLATWRVLVHAVFHETLHYITAPKTLSISSTPSKPKKSI